MIFSIAIFLCLASLSTSLNLPTTGNLTKIAADGHKIPKGVVQLSVAVKINGTKILDTIQALARREVVDPLVNTQTGTLYTISLTIGTPAQPVTVQIDTGSSDLWVDPQCANAGSSGSVALCNSYPVYNPYKSSTAYDTGDSMSIGYGRGNCNGEYLIDTVSFGGASLLQQEFGYVTSSSELSLGIMGISFGAGLGTNYYNVIDQLTLQGYTASRAFSLDLGNVDTSSGSIIFGGIDTKKYYGALEKLPIISYNQAPDGYPRYWIYMSSVGITKPGANSKVYTVPSYNQAVFLDSGGTLSRLPTNLVNAIVADFPGAVNQGNGLYTVPCSYASMAGTVDFGFGNTVIRVPYHQFIWVAGTNVCVLGVVATTDVTWVLGDTFLRAAFVVYDQDNENVLLANAANCGTNLVAIGKGANAVPSITGACSAPTSTASASSSQTSKSSSKASTISPTKVSAVKTASPTPAIAAAGLSSTRSSTSSLKTSTSSMSFRVSTSSKSVTTSSKASSKSSTSASTNSRTSTTQTTTSKTATGTKQSVNTTSSSFSITSPSQKATEQKQVAADESGNVSSSATKIVSSSTTSSSTTRNTSFRTSTSSRTTSITSTVTLKSKTTSKSISSPATLTPWLKTTSSSSSKSSSSTKSTSSSAMVSSSIKYNTTTGTHTTATTTPSTKNTSPVKASQCSSKSTSSSTKNSSTSTTTFLSKATSASSSKTSSTSQTTSSSDPCS